jgi:hypothetical protein
MLESLQTPVLAMVDMVCRSRMDTTVSSGASGGTDDEVVVVLGLLLFRVTRVMG